MMARFIVRYTIHGESTAEVEAETIELARRMINDQVDANDFDIDLDEIHSVDFHVSELHPVIRDGKRIWTTYLRATDERVEEASP